MLRGGGGGENKLSQLGCFSVNSKINNDFIQPDARKLVFFF